MYVGFLGCFFFEQLRKQSSEYLRNQAADWIGLKSRIDVIDHVEFESDVYIT